MGIMNFGSDAGLDPSFYGDPQQYDNFSFDVPELSLQNWDRPSYEAGELALGNWGYNPDTYQNPMDQSLWNGPTAPRTAPATPMAPAGDWMRQAMAKSQVYNERGQLTNPMPGLRTRNSNWGAWDGAAGAGNANGRATSSAGGMMNQAWQNYNANLEEAKRRALADRAQALGRAEQFGDYRNSPDVAQYRQLAARLQKNPFGPEFLAQSVDRQREMRMQQLAAAEANLKQHYANMGRTVPPSVLAYLRAQMTQQENSDVRNTQLDSAQLGFNADLNATQAYGQMVGQIGNLEGQANQAIYNVLANTNYIPSGQELAFLMQLASQGGGQ